MSGSDPGDDRTGLDARVRDLPRETHPPRDLWPGIEARLEPRTITRAPRPAWPWQAAAAVLLVAGSSLLTATLMNARRDGGTMPPESIASAGHPGSGQVQAMPVAFGPGRRLDPEYLSAREQLTVVLEQRLAGLPGSTRFKLESNLAELRHAAEQINSALDEQPGDPLLEELLLATYQQELAVLANVNQLTDALAATGQGAEPKRMKL